MRHTSQGFDFCRHVNENATRNVNEHLNRIQAGVAACLIGTIAYACELYDNEVTRREEHFSNSSKENCDDKQRRRFRSSESVASDIVKNRRFEQVVECILCGVDVKKRKKEHATTKKQKKKMQ